ncbi:unnamed protein product [Haemonchus placei]|uniref:Major sperm protein n=1 Tax=Haemonchus placei TaxID=6290 RepID=A0A0N4X9S0_HAEPC|nr:unnamed protein product [Haemonchus placei]
MASEVRKSGSGGERTARIITGHRTPHQPGQEPMIAIALSDMEYVMRTARSARCTTREREPGCTCCCHLKSAITISPRSAHFTVEGGLSIHNIKNISKTRLAIKITCSDNTLYRVTPVYAILEPEEVVVLNIGRLDGQPKKDRLGILMIDFNEREPGCTCCCHLKSAITISPRSAHFTVEGGLSIHNIKNISKSKLFTRLLHDFFEICHNFQKTHVNVWEFSSDFDNNTRSTELNKRDKHGK